MKQLSGKRKIQIAVLIVVNILILGVFGPFSSYRESPDLLKNSPEQKRIEKKIEVGLKDDGRNMVSKQNKKKKVRNAIDVRDKPRETFSEYTFTAFTEDFWYHYKRGLGNYQKVGLQNTMIIALLFSIYWVFVMKAGFWKTTGYMLIISSVVGIVILIAALLFGFGPGSGGRRRNRYYD